jgi:hypothetical protein
VRGYFGYMYTYAEWCKGRKHNMIAKGIRKFKATIPRYGKSNSYVLVSIQHRHIFKGRWELTGKVALRLK